MGFSVSLLPVSAPDNNGLPGKGILEEDIGRGKKRRFDLLRTGFVFHRHFDELND
jgi:hypothetical protein